MNIQNNLGYVESTPVKADWHSKDWIFEGVKGGYKRVKCRWGQSPAYIHVENLKDAAQYGSSDTVNKKGSNITKWLSAMWTIDTKGYGNRVWLPHPNKKTKAFHIVDTPRIIPAEHGYNYPGKELKNNGWDLDNDAADVYVFLPKGDGYKLRQDFIDLTGKSDLIPLYAFGTWDSWWHRYTAKEALAKIDTYREKDIPLDVFVVDTNWRAGGSDGYTIQKKYFPDMKQFMKTAHGKNVKIAFNDHPAATTDKALDPKEVYYRNYEGLKTIFDTGLDVWWYDRNWPKRLKCPEGLNIETWGMYVYHSITKGYYPNRRPMIMANEDGLGNFYKKLLEQRAPNMASHRFSIHWTGDTNARWVALEREIHAMLRFGLYEPYAYTSTDVGGFKGTPSRDLYIRYVQYGTLSPIMRLHSVITSCGRQPWAFAEPAEDVARNFIKMRYRLLPVFYTAARKNYDTGEPICRRSDLEFPEHSEAESNSQYLLGDSGILVAPIFEDSDSRSVWIPPGQWSNVWTGEVVTGPKTITAKADIRTMPLYVKYGSIIPLAPDMSHTSEKAWDTITLDVFPSSDAKAETSFYEDANEGNGYKTGEFRTTNISALVDDNDKQVKIAIDAVKGSFKQALSERAWKIRLRRPLNWNGLNVTGVKVNGITTSFSKVKQDQKAMPFANEGGAPDSDLIEISIPKRSTSELIDLTVQFD